MKVRLVLLAPCVLLLLGNTLFATDMECYKITVNARFGGGDHSQCGGEILGLTFSQPFAYVTDPFGATNGLVAFYLFEPGSGMNPESGLSDLVTVDSFQQQGLDGFFIRFHLFSDPIPIDIIRNAVSHDPPGGVNQATEV